MKSLLTALFLVASAGCQAEAQNITIHEGSDSNLPEAYSVRLPIRVVESFSVPLTANDNATSTSSDQAVTAARKQLYRTMQQECSTLSDSFNAECRIASFTISLAKTFGPPAGGANATPPGPSLRSVDASVSYGLKVRE